MKIDEKSMSKLPANSDSRALKYPYVTRSVVVWDPDWTWLKNNKFHYGCSSASEFVRRLIKAEKKHPRKGLIVQMD